MTHLRCPTCISLAILGEEKSTIIFCLFERGGGLIPLLSRSLICELTNLGEIKKYDIGTYIYNIF